MTAGNVKCCKTVLVSSHGDSRPRLLTYSPFKLTLSYSFHIALLYSHCIMHIYNTLNVHLLLKPGVSDNEHSLIQVDVPANVTIHKK